MNSKYKNKVKQKLQVSCNCQNWLKILIKMALGIPSYFKFSENKNLRMQTEIQSFEFFKSRGWIICICYCAVDGW